MDITGWRMLGLLLLSVATIKGDDIHGVDFILTIVDVYNHLYASAGEKPTSFQLHYPSGAVKNNTLDPYRSLHFIFTDTECVESGVENKTLLLHVENEQDIQIRTQTDKGLYTPIPIYGLGTHYIVSSCFPHPSSRSGYTFTLVVATHSLRATITITFNMTGIITYSNKTYNNGHVLTVRLDRYQTFTLSHIPHDITGTVVESSQTVAVFSGTRHERYIYGYDQMLPVTRLGTDFILAFKDVLSEPINQHYLTVVTEHDKTRLMFNDGVEVVVNKDVHYQHIVTPREVLHFNTSHPVQSTVCLNPGFMNIPPLSVLPKQAMIFTDRPTETKILSRNPDDVTILESRDAERTERTVKWKDISNSTYRIASVNHAGTLLIKSNSTVSVFGRLQSRGIFNGGYDLSGGFHYHCASTVVSIKQAS